MEPRPETTVRTRVAPSAAQTQSHEHTVLTQLSDAWSVGQHRVLRRLSDMRLWAVPSPQKPKGPDSVVLTRLDVAEESEHLLLEHSQLAAQLSHPHTAKVFPSDVSADGAYWATACVPGVTLRDVVAKCKAEMKTLPIGVSLGIVYEAALGAAAVQESGLGAHGLLHPGSIQVSFEGPVQLLNVGLVRCFSLHRQRSQWLDAMAPYLPPESIALGCVPDPQSDVFVLAAVLFEVVSGMTLFPAKTFQERTKLPPLEQVPTLSHLVLKSSLDALLRKALHPDRSRRYPHAKAFAAALQEAVGEYIWKKEQRADFIHRAFFGRVQSWKQWQEEAKALTSTVAEAEARPASVEAAPLLTSLPPAATPAAPSNPRAFVGDFKNGLGQLSPRTWAVAGAVPLLLVVAWMLRSPPNASAAAQTPPPAVAITGGMKDTLARPTTALRSEPWGPDSVGELRKSLTGRTPKRAATVEMAPSEARAKRMAAWRARQETARAAPPWLRSR